MAKIALARAVAWAMVGGVLACISHAAEMRADLYGQAASALLERSFALPGVEYLLLDLRTHKTVAMHWDHPEAEIPVGSLLKPFVALAYSQMHAGDARRPFPAFPPFPSIRCHGKADGCWKPGGHGLLTLEPALARSCNAYFLSLAGELSASGMDALSRVSARYGLPSPPAPATPQSLIGLTSEWRITPATLANAYALLASESENSLTGRVLRGMQLAAGPDGTASRIGAHPGGVLAKTGTAPCRERSCVASGDGLVVVLAPAGEPQVLLLVRQRGKTGAQTATLAGRMLTALEAAHAR
jgi:cell division protein FtsI/penicillin-binding protein 2